LSRRATFAGDELLVTGCRSMIGMARDGRATKQWRREISGQCYPGRALAMG
jgi:hypothetical protein